MAKTCKRLSKWVSRGKSVLALPKNGSVLEFIANKKDQLWNVHTQVWMDTSMLTMRVSGGLTLDE